MPAADDEFAPFMLTDRQCRSDGLTIRLLQSCMTPFNKFECFTFFLSINFGIRVGNQIEQFTRLHTCILSTHQCLDCMNTLVQETSNAR